jgi:hypothetical protein
MGALVNLWEQAGFGERGEPTGRAALLRLASALSATETEIERVLAGTEKLAAEMGAAADAKRALAEKIVGEAAALVAKMKQGAAWTLGQFGARSTRKTAELLSASSIEAAIGDAALAEAAEELQRLEAQRERLRVAQAGVIKEVVREALQEALLADYGVLLERLQETTARLKGIERFLSPPSADYQPGASRLALSVPNFAKADGSDQAVVVESREIAKVEAFLHSFAASLEHDPRAPAPELPEFDDGADPSIPYHELTGAERRQIDREFVLPANQHRQTTDAMLFEEQQAKAFSALTN